VTTEPRIDVQDIDHLGIIAGIIDDIGIVEIIDQELGTDIRDFGLSEGLIVSTFLLTATGSLLHKDRQTKTYFAVHWCIFSQILFFVLGTSRN